MGRKKRTKDIHKSKTLLLLYVGSFCKQTRESTSDGPEECTI